jgi:hypothetical protein
MLYPIRILLASCAISMVSATCYKKGEDGNKQTALNGIRTACLALQGFFAGNQERTKCISVDTDSTYWFIVAKNEGSGGTLTADFCVERLSREINACAKGGAREQDGWWFR